MRDTLHLFVNGQPVRVVGEDAWLMLSTYLRRRRGLTGIKVVCAEGDCGSCTVLVGRVVGERLVYRSALSCILCLAQLDGSHVVTVEGLLVDGRLNGFQQAMVREHGAQCGFCTPGIVAAVQGLRETGRALDEHDVRRGLSGNLCRCTGYDAILRAATADDAAIIPALDDLFPPKPIVEALVEATSDSMVLDVDDRTFARPRSIAEAVEFLASSDRPVVIAGGTDLGVVHNKAGTTPSSVIAVDGIDELRSIQIDDGGDRSALIVGASASLKAFQEAIAEHIPEVTEFLEWFGSPQVRHLGTLGGNLCTASPIGDTLPLMHVLGASVEAVSARGRRLLSIADLHTGYRQTALADDELLASVRVPLLGPGEHLRLYKVSRRKDLDISSVSAAFAFRFESGRLDLVRVAFGGVAATVARMTDVETMLDGKRPSRELFEEAGELASSSIDPISDVRGSAAYRRTLCRNLFLKLWHEIDGGRFNGDGHDGGDDDAPSRSLGFAGVTAARGEA